MDDAKLAALEAELRRDLEALTRVRAMMAFKESTLLKPDDRQMPLANIGPTLVAAPEPTSDSEDDDSDPTSLRGAIHKAIIAEPNARWTTQRVFAKLQQDRFQFGAQKPLISVGQALKALCKQGKVRITRHGVGSSPNIYKGLEKPQQATEASSANESLAG